MTGSNDETRAAERQCSDAETEREVRSRRKFSLAEAIGRSAGSLLRGHSPVTRRRQAEFMIEELVDRHLADAEGALGVVLVREIKQSEELLSGYDAPLTVLRRVIERTIASDERLRAFVKRVDAEWGRIYLERPRFDPDDSPPERDDPYTIASVRSRLQDLLHRLEETRSPTV